MLKEKFNIKRAFGISFILISLGFALLPMIWALVLSFRSKSHVFEPVWESPTAFTFGNFASLLDADFMHSLFNSFLTASISTFLAVLVGVPAGFALAKGNIGNKLFASWSMLLLRMAPPVGFVIPMFLIYTNIGFIDTFFGLIIAYLIIALPLVVWASWTSMAQIPTELIEASLLDGATLPQTLALVVIPVAKPGIIAASVLAFLLVWNDFFFALIITRDETITAPVAIVNFVSYASVDWGSIALASVILTLPTLPLILFANKYIVQSMAGSVKG